MPFVPPSDCLVLLACANMEYGYALFDGAGRKWSDRHVVKRISRHDMRDCDLGLCAIIIWLSLIHI